MEVLFTGYNPSTKEMKPIAVAMYAYDGQGRLRAEWDPRISPALKTVYGYDSEGHVTALTPPGQESWAFTYGEIAGDSSTGRLLKATQAPTSAGLWNGEAVKNTEAPKLSGTAVVGVTMGVSNGTWSNSPVAYGYQWEDCNSEGKACTPIAGAANANYQVAESDIGHMLVAEVWATNSGGSVATASSASAVVEPLAATITEHKLSGSGAPYGITVGGDKNLWFTDGGVVAKMNVAGSVLGEYATDEDQPEGITTGPGETGSGSGIWFVEHTARHVGEMNLSGTLSEYTLSERSDPGSVSIVTGPEEHVVHRVVYRPYR